MAIGKAECRCKTCGKIFVKEKYCYKRSEANAFEAWAVSHYDECPSCYYARMESEAVSEAQKYDLPELTGSQKQIKWAASMRRDLIAEVKSRYSKFPRAAEAVIRYICKDRTDSGKWIEIGQARSYGGLNYYLAKSKAEIEKIVEEGKIEQLSVVDSGENYIVYNYGQKKFFGAVKIVVGKTDFSDAICYAERGGLDENGEYQGRYYESDEGDIKAGTPRNFLTYEKTADADGNTELLNGWMKKAAVKLLG